MSKEKIECCVKNCGAKIPIDEALVIKGQYFCRICGTAYYRTFLNF